MAQSIHLIAVVSIFSGFKPIRPDRLQGLGCRNSVQQRRNLFQRPDVIGHLAESSFRRYQGEVFSCPAAFLAGGFLNSGDEPFDPSS
jgi:hypothetical protein